MPRSPLMWIVLSPLLLPACGGGGTGPSGGPLCTAAVELPLQVAEVRLVNPRLESNCLELLGGTAEREYLVVPYAGTGTETTTGVEGAFQLTTALEGTGAGSLLAGRLAAAGPQPGDGANAFHLSLREAEARLPRPAGDAGRAGVGRVLQPPPEVGDESVFRVCASLGCGSTVPITAAARYVGTSGIVWVDTEMPDGAQALTMADLEQLGLLFDDHLFPIGTTAFGATSDIDVDGHISIVITDQVNDLTEDCSDGRVVGYFFGGDLLVSQPGSNQGEVFFAFAPKPATATCPAVSRVGALRSLAPVLIHELQHMISFNQHVLLRGRADEVVWLNEGLSHFAEELAQRLVPDERCPNSSSCYSLFATGNIQNAYLYLEDPEATPLVAPSEGLTLAGRGAAWLFVRWMADHFSSDTLRGTTLTRALLTGTSSGAANAAAATGLPFATLAGEWLAANWLDDLGGFPQAGRFRYRSWNFRSVFAANHPTPPFVRPFPLLPALSNGSSTHAGTLRGGSGYYLRVVLPAGSDRVTVELSGTSPSVPVSTQLDPRVAVVRIR
jgi:hypothetical protein